MTSAPSRLALKIVVAILALIPISTGATGVALGLDFPAFSGDAGTVDADSHFRFLSGVFLAVGLGFWSCVPGLERKTGRFRLLAALVFAGGLARLWSALVTGLPGIEHSFGLAMEFAVVPALVAWQASIEASD